MKEKSIIKRGILAVIGVLITLLPLSVKALEEELKYEASFKFYKVDKEWQNKFYDLEEETDNWIDNVFLNGTAVEINNDTELKPGDLIAVAPIVKLIDGKTANAVEFSLSFEYDDNILNYIDSISDKDIDGSNSPFSGTKRSWQNVYIENGNSKVVLVYYNLSSATYENTENLPVHFVLFQIDENAELGTITRFEFLNENYFETVTGYFDESKLLIEQPMIINNYLLTVGSGIMHTELLMEPNNILASTQIDKIKSYEINRNENEDYVIGIDPYTTLIELKNSFPNYNDYLKIYDITGEEVTKPNDFINTGMILKLEKNNEILDTLRIIVRGDLNFDGKVTISDYKMLLNYIGRKYIFDEHQTLAADLNKDGKVSAVDQIAFLNYVARRISDINSIG